MSESEHEAALVEQRRELVRVATGILIARYAVPAPTAESALMDWSRVTGVPVHDLAERVIADARRPGRDLP